MFPLHNATVRSLYLKTPSGCMGECPWFEMNVLRTGAIDYRGIANVEPVGQHRGRVNYIAFDAIASVVETSGFLDLPETDDQRIVSTVGKTAIGVAFLDGRERLFVRDALDKPPIFWAVSRLLQTLLEDVQWGDANYTKADAIYAAHGREPARDEALEADEAAAIERGILDAKEIKNGFVLCPHCRTKFPLYSHQFWDGEKHLSCRTRIRLPEVIRNITDREELKKILVRKGQWIKIENP